MTTASAGKRHARLLVSSCLVFLAMSAEPAAATEVVTRDVVRGGIYSDRHESADDLDALNAAATRRVTFAGSFHRVGENTGYSATRWILEQAWLGEATPFANFAITEFDVDDFGKPGTAAAIAAGHWDPEIDEWRSHLQSFLARGGNRSVIIAPLQEMNGSWVPYGCDPDSFRAAYRRVVDRFRAAGIDQTTVRFAFAPNGWTSTGCGTIADYYPGHDYVDVVAVSAFNFACFSNTAWGSPSFLLDGPLGELRAVAPHRPILIAQTATPRGCASPGGATQDSWVRDLFSYAASYPNVAGVVYFNIDTTIYGETDWRVWRDSAAAQGWVDAMSHPSTRYEWPLLDWFRPGELIADTAAWRPCPGGVDCASAVLVGPWRGQSVGASTTPLNTAYVEGTWLARRGLGWDGTATAFHFGNPGDIPFVGDWNCDGIKTPGVYRASQGIAYLRNRSTGGVADIAYAIGNEGDIPLAGDFNGDGCDTVSIYRPSTGRVFIFDRLGGTGPAVTAVRTFVLGNPGDIPLVGDFNGDGIDTVSLYRPSDGRVFVFDRLGSDGAPVTPARTYAMGNPGDQPFVADFDGRGSAVIAVYRPTTGLIYWPDMRGGVRRFDGWGPAFPQTAHQRLTGGGPHHMPPMI